MENNFIKHSNVDLECEFDLLIRRLNDSQFHLRKYLNRRIGIPMPPRILQTPNPTLDNINLSKREYEILFLLYLGKSELETSKYLAKIHGNIAGRTTIGFKIRMFNKLSVYSNDELIDKAIALNLVRTLPESFIIVT